MPGKLRHDITKMLAMLGTLMLLATPALAQDGEGEPAGDGADVENTDDATEPEEPAGDEGASDEGASDEGASDEGAAGGGEATGGEGETGQTGEDGTTGEEGGQPPVPEADVRALTNQRLREIGSRVDALKEDTFATKSRLLLLRESVLGGTIAGSGLIVVHKNEMGAEYELVQVLYSLDGEKMFSKRDYDNGLDKYDGEEVINEPVVPGSRNLTVQMVFKGNNWGIFRYMDGYTFTVTGAHQFTAEEGKQHTLIVRAVEAGNFFTPYEERPTFEFDMESRAIESANQ